MFPIQTKPGSVCIAIWISKLYSLPLDTNRTGLYCNMAYFIIFDEKPAGQGFCKGFTNMRGVSRFTGIKYDTLVDHFTRKRLRWYFYDEQGIKVIKVEDMEKGRQGVNTFGTEHNRNI